MAKKMAKSAVTKAHKIARAVARSGSGVRNPYAVGMAAEKRHLRRIHHK